MIGTIRHDNCMNIMADMIQSNHHVDLIVTDPPYKLTSGGKSLAPDSKHRPMRGGWMRSYSNNGNPVFCEVKFTDWLPLAYKVLRDNADIYAMANDKNIGDMLNAFHAAGFGVHNILVWDKRTATANRWYMKNCEFIVYGWKGRAKTINNPSSMMMVSVPQVDESNHPTEKPVALMEYLILNSSIPGETVFDPFMGSGTTGVAAQNVGRKFYGVEIDSQFYAIAEHRLSIKRNGVLL